MSDGRMREILSLVPSAHGKALDVGCGAGGLGVELKRKGWNVVGVDITDNTDFCFDIENENWPDALVSQKFDLIIASEVIEHIFSPEQLLLQIRNILADGGNIIITTPNVLFWKNRFKMIFGIFRYEDTGIMDFGHIRFFTLQTARELFAKVGLRIVRESHVYPNLRHRGLDFFGRMFPGLFAYQLVFKLSKRT